MKKTKWSSPAVALALAVSALLVSRGSFAQQGQTDRYGSRKPACGCYVCGTPLTVSFEDKDCAGILAEAACGERLAKLSKEQRERFCQKIKAQGKFKSFKDSCRAYAPYCEPETTAAQGPASGVPASPAQPDKSPPGKGTTPQAGTPSTGGGGGLDAVQALTPSTTQAASHPLASLQVNPAGVTGGIRVQGTVELREAPGQNGLTVTLESSDPHLASLPPSVTFTHGTASADTGPLAIKATFPIDTYGVLETKNVVIKARAGVQTLQANLHIKMPVVQIATLDAPNICDGSNKGKVKYTLTGLAAAGLKVSANVQVQSPDGSFAPSSASETVPTGNSAGSFHITLPRCQAHNPGQRCNIHGYVQVPGGSSVSISGSCGHPPD